MGKLKLTYFDFDGGRGEVPRIALTLGGIDFDDDRVAFADWQSRKPDTPFGAMPVLEIDGRRLAQSNTINRYVGKLAGLYPSDPWQAALCDEAMDAVEDIAQKIVPTFDMAEPAKQTAREALAAGPIPFFLRGLEARLEANGGRYFADDRLTVADLKVALWVRHLRSDALDHVPPDLPERVAPKLVQHFDRVTHEPGVVAYYAIRAAES